MELLKKFHTVCLDQLTPGMLMCSELLKGLMKYRLGHNLQFISKLKEETSEKTVEGMKYAIENPLILLQKSGVVKFSDGYKISFNEKNKKSILAVIYFALSNGIRFGEGKFQWKFDQIKGIIETHQGIKFSVKNVGLLDETFLYETHFSGFDIENQTVVTGGAYIGDTPLYYSYYGARVFGFEPDPNSFMLAKENISLNPDLEKNITLTNYAIGKDSMVNFPINEDSGVSSIFETQKRRIVSIRSVSISTILDEFYIKNPYLLDLDIKGAEFDIINDESISNFKKVRLEYSPYILHNEKKLYTLVDKLKDYGFVKSRIYKHYPLRFDLINHGTIYAEK